MQLTKVVYPNIQDSHGNQATIPYSWNPNHDTLLTVIGVELNSTTTDSLRIGYDATVTPIHLASINPGSSLNANLGDAYSYTSSSGVITSVTTTFPNNSTRKMTINSAGYITQDIRDSGESAKKQTFDITRDGVTNFVTAVLEEEDPSARCTGIHVRLRRQCYPTESLSGHRISVRDSVLLHQQQLCLRLRTL